MVYTGPKGSYFGYSVDILALEPGGKDQWLLVGAPKADDVHQPDLKEPGALYKCSPSTTSCWPVVVDDSGNIRQVIPKWKNVTVHHSKNKQWLGATLQVDNANGKVVVCAPRWKDREYYVQGHEFMNGLCYESSYGLTFNDSSAWPALEYFRKQIHQTGHYVFGMGALGTSACYAKDGSFLLLGAPGINDWTGGLVLITGDLESRPHIHEPPRIQYNNSYIGYSVTAARLTSDGEFIVAGAPRADNKGKVFVYDQSFNIMFIKEGTQFGSYFGASVCAVDLTGDLLDEIVVGAPLFTDKYDEGRVFVFVNGEFFSLEQHFPALSGSNSPGARFGTTVANIGDINRDGFEDLAVGAPFEEDMVGVVYIYNGSPDGMHQQFSQRIVGTDVSRHIRAFGWTFSQQHDLDNNFYPDVAVGAYASDNAVLLLSRPVIDLHIQMSLQPPVIDPGNHANCLYKGAPAQCITPVVCFKYTGVQLNDNMYAEFTMTFDTLERNRNERRRLFVFNQNTGNEEEQLSEILHLRRGSAICRSDFTVFTRKSRDLITPLQIEVSVTVPQQTGCDLCPVLNMYNPTTIAAQAKFAKDCGMDDICQSALFMTVKPEFSGRDSYLVLDDSASFDLKVDLGNTGETAYQSMVRLIFPDSVSFSRLRVLSGTAEVACLPQRAGQDNETSVIECDVEEPVQQGQVLILFVRFYVINWSYDLESFNVTVEVTTASEESDLSDNANLVTIPVRLKSKLQLTEVSLPSQLDLPSEGPTDDDNGDAWTHIKHIYDIKNFGPSLFPHGSIIILLPYSKWIHVSSIQMKVENTDTEVKDACTLRQLPFSPPDTIIHRSAEPTAAPVKLVKMVCSPGMCTNVTCELPHIHSDNGIYISINISIRRDIIKQLQIHKEMHIISTAELVEPDYTTFISLTEIKNASFDFFKRKKRDELQKLMLEAESERNGVTIINSDEANDVMVLPTITFLNSNHQDINFNHHNHQWSSPGPHPAFSNDTYLEPINMRS
ncbi:integrin alpha-4-like isoform X2 [Gigantopelta aegis]|uniref:integrin alpha-4-like isoform X2 n=1 Tax=Gigantopelta aegis TaxID=1735272 RepID=UPI001B88D8F6|nr:integrin alpha-4-like isoform X2 [Gigantopelta aegis]